MTAKKDEPVEEVAPPSIAAKLAAAIESVDRIGRDGTNEFHNYTYTSAEQVYRVIRKPLLEQGLVIIPSVAESTSTGQTTITKFHMRIMDADSDDVIEAYWMGEGQDKQDKGGYKAATGAAKTWLKHLFMLPADDDPEADHATDAGPARTPTKMDHLGALIEDIGFSNEEKGAIKEWIKWNRAENVDAAIELLEDGSKTALLAAVKFGEVEVAA